MSGEKMICPLCHGQAWANEKIDGNPLFVCDDCHQGFIIASPANDPTVGVSDMVYALRCLGDPASNMIANKLEELAIEYSVLAGEMYQKEMEVWEGHGQEVQKKSAGLTSELTAVGQNFLFN